MNTSPITGYVVVLSYYDKSGNIAAFGPYSSSEAANVAVDALKLMPLADGDLEVLPLFGAPGSAGDR